MNEISRCTMKLHTKLILLIGALIIFLILILGSLFQYILLDTVEDQIGQRALRVALTISHIPEIRKAFSEPEPWTIIQPIVEEIRAHTEAEFIVVGNREGIRYSHPIPERIGKEMVGGDNGPVLEGKSIISEAIGSLGPSLRGKTPIFDDEGNVIGIVSVGFLIEDMDDLTWKYTQRMLFVIGIMIFVGGIGAVFIARNVKKATFGLEPKEIGTLYQEKQAILESIREGIIAVNRKGIITLANQATKRLLGLAEGEVLVGKPITDIVSNSRLLEVMNKGISEYDQEMFIGDNEVVVNRIPILDYRGQVIGAVSSFRNKSELFRLTQELSQVKKYAEVLRSQTHEYSNKLYLISGLLQLESYQEAIDLITKESDIHQNLLYFIMKEIPDPIVGGLLIGKFNRASELKVELEVDRESSLRDIPEELDRSQLVTIIGNLIDNAMEAVFESHTDNRKVTVFLTDIGEDLIIEVEDNGTGIADEVADQIFEIGYSTKGSTNRGYGLYLVKKAIDTLSGYITYKSEMNKGTIFTVVIPKRKVK